MTKKLFCDWPECNEDISRDSGHLELVWKNVDIGSLIPLRATQHMCETHARMVYHLVTGYTHLDKI